jgi:hypothetical protein
MTSQEFEIKIVEWDFSDSNFKKIIEKQLQIMMMGNKLFSREDIFKNKGYKRMELIPGSQSFKKYGKHIAIKDFSLLTIEEIEINLNKEPRIATYGSIKGTILNENNKEIVNAEFMSYEIFKVWN